MRWALEMAVRFFGMVAGICWGITLGATGHVHLTAVLLAASVALVLPWRTLTGRHKLPLD